MQSYQREFVRFAVECGVLRFGQFTLKSGRSSPYFFNAGQFNTGDRLARLGRFYAEATLAANLPFDMLYGPAYKGIPLVASVAIALAQRSRDLPYAFNRKETKDHGEGGNIIGSALQGRVLIVDDVISAGTSIGESVNLIKNAGATPVGAIIALDRQERGRGTLSAVQEVESKYGLRVVSVAQLDTLIVFLSESGAMAEHLAAVSAYRATYGV